MPLNIPTESGEGSSAPYLKFRANEGRFFVRHEGVDIQIDSPRLAIDFANVKTGWFMFMEGMGAQKVFDPAITEMAQKPPGDKFKRGFMVHVLGRDPLPHVPQGIGLREFMSTSINVCCAIDKMYSAYEAGAVANPGKVPVYTFQGTNRVPGGMGSINHEPIFELTSWVDRARVPEFDQHLAEQAAAQAAPALVGNGLAPSASDPFAPSAPVPPPARGPTPPAGFGAPAQQTALAQELDDEIPF
jgi:hypothetical protein